MGAWFCDSDEMAGQVVMLNPVRCYCVTLVASPCGQGLGFTLDFVGSYPFPLMHIIGNRPPKPGKNAIRMSWVLRSNVARPELRETCHYSLKDQ